MYNDRKYIATTQYYVVLSIEKMKIKTYNLQVIHMLSMNSC